MCEHQQANCRGLDIFTEDKIIHTIVNSLSPSRTMRLKILNHLQRTSGEAWGCKEYWIVIAKNPMNKRTEIFCPRNYSVKLTAHRHPMKLFYNFNKPHSKI